MRCETIQHGQWSATRSRRREGEPGAAPGWRAAPGTPSAGRLEGLTSIVVLAFNQVHLTRACVESVLAHTAPPYELILVNNGSRDGTGRYFADLARRHPRVRAIHMERNHGVYARSFGMQAARGEYICWLDNDVVVGPGWLEPLLRALADPGVGGAGAEGVALTPDWQHRFHTQGMRPEEAAGRAVDVLVGYCCLYRNLTERIGGLDPRFHPFWNEDADYSLAVKLLGYRLVVAPTNVVHRRHGTGLALLPDLEAHIARMNRELIEKWDPLKERVLECYRCASA